MFERALATNAVEYLGAMAMLQALSRRVVVACGRTAT